MSITDGPIPVAGLSKAWVCVRSLAAFGVSNLTYGMDACLLWVLCVKLLRLYEAIFVVCVVDFGLKYFSFRWKNYKAIGLLNSALYLGTEALSRCEPAMFKVI